MHLKSSLRSQLRAGNWDHGYIWNSKIKGDVERLANKVWRLSAKVLHVSFNTFVQQTVNKLQHTNKMILKQPIHWKFQSTLLPLLAHNWRPTTEFAEQKRILFECTKLQCLIWYYSLFHCGSFWIKQNGFFFHVWSADAAGVWQNEGSTQANHTHQSKFP